MRGPYGILCCSASTCPLSYPLLLAPPPFPRSPIRSYYYPANALLCISIAIIMSYIAFVSFNSMANIEVRHGVMSLSHLLCLSSPPPPWQNPDRFNGPKNIHEFRQFE